MSSNIEAIPQWKVEVWLYDLSMGMARSFSQALLGKHIEAIYHTGVVVYGLEFFFGGGIMATSPGASQAGQPMRKIEMGFTSIDQATFYEYLRGISDRYTPQTYSLLSHNCNNFSSEVVKFLTGTDIPSYITGLPEEALSSPQGAMFRPMIMQMEQQFRQSGGGMIPWSPDLLNLPPIRQIEPDRMHRPNDDDTRAINHAQQVLHSGPSIPGEATSILARTASGEAGAHAHHPHAALQLKTISASSKPLISAEAKTPAFYALVKSNQKKAPASAALSDDDRIVLEAVLDALNNKSDLKPEVEDRAIQLFDRLLHNWPADLLFPVLGLYRLFVLRSRVGKAIEDNQSVITFLFSLVPQTDEAKTSPPSTPAPMAAQAMALCSVANLFHRPSLASKLASHSSVLAAARASLTSEHNSVRAMAATILYNCSLALPKDESDDVIELVSFFAEFVMNESDPETLQRSLSALGHLLYGNSSAALLLASMDFDTKSIAAKCAGNDKLTSSLALINDINAILEHEQKAMLS